MAVSQCSRDQTKFCKVNKMKIGIIGAGNIGGTLGRHWAKVGHEVMFSSRNPADLQPMAIEAHAKVGTVRKPPRSVI
jgi:predicted dinucleotide-binding enzyme